MYPTDENFMDHYFARVYAQLAAQVDLYNSNIPHNGLKGSQNEKALAEVLRAFLPSRFGVSTGAILFDRHGAKSKQIDIVIYDATRPNFFGEMFPIESVHATIEVKTTLTSAEADGAIANHQSVNALAFRPTLSYGAQTQTKKEGYQQDPPISCIFAYRTDTKAFETFAGWFQAGGRLFYNGVRLLKNAPRYSEHRYLLVCSLDQGMLELGTGSSPRRTLTVVPDEASEETMRRSLETTLFGVTNRVDPAKSLFFFMYSLWSRLERHRLNPEFDIRTYMSETINTGIPVPDLPRQTTPKKDA